MNVFIKAVLSKNAGLGIYWKYFDQRGGSVCNFKTSSLGK
jgi:hypothetical protein